MLRFKQDDTDVQIVVTLSELCSLPDPSFLFVFTHVTTKDIIAFVKLNSDDESDYPTRYNQFTIDPSLLFSGMPIGQWHYTVYEQDSVSNLDPALSGAAVEYGKMMMDRSEAFAFSKYDSSTTYKVYNG